ncbi:MAG TPA: DNA recombination protein RmuC [Steroidobacteraceae bacterium]|nr:DNA recombination protein RmuC [Steroidobacteraceae bacterium]HNS27959.1 DNA recombination protein RmuC [Steroidobacteraceae bacterium]
MSTAVIAAIGIGGFLLGALIGWLVAQLRAARHAAGLGAALEAARARLQADEERAQAQVALLTQSEARLRAAFDELASESLRANSEVFLALARESLGREHATVQGALKERESAFNQLIEPIRAALARTEAEVQALERERREAFTTLRTQIESLTSGQAQLARETRNLVTALRRPEVRGRWGELTLRRVVELAGLTEHADFTEQAQVATGSGALRPDLVVHMPEERDLVVDAKTPLDAYLEAVEADNDEARRLALGRHAQQVEARVRELAGKAYWSQFARSPEFAVLFLPGDQFLSSALTERPDLIDNALKQSVVIATPSTLMALLKAVAYGWRQAQVAQNAAEIRDLGQELYRRLGNFSGHLAKVGQRLGNAVESYNSAVGSLERQVMPQARRFTELGVTGDAALANLEPVERLVREPASAPGDNNEP